MLQAKATRRWAGDDENEGRTGGPGGARAPGQGPGSSLASAEDDRHVKTIYLSGGAARFVLAPQLTVLIARRLRESGLIETRQDVRNRLEAKLTPNGLQRVIGGGLSANTSAAAAL